MVTLATSLAAGATVVALAFTLALADRWLARRRRHERAWLASMVMFTVASGALWWGAGIGWSPLAFRCFYLFGAILNVPWLALGTIELLAGERWGRAVGRVLAVGSGFAAGVVLQAPLRAPVKRDGLPAGRDVFGPLPRVLAGVASAVATLVLIGGALWSAWRLWRAGARSRSATPVGDGPSTPPLAPRRLAAGNVLIALGTLILGASGTLNARLGAAKAFAVTLTIGVVVLFAGFLVATSASTPNTGSSVAPWLTDALDAA
jgi:hypothetical protein